MATTCSQYLLHSSPFLLNSQLQGINIADKHILINQLADDTVDHIKVFSKASGLTLNFDKCELLPIKSCSARSLYSIPVRPRASYLSVIICKDDSARGRQNFDPVIAKA